MKIFLSNREFVYILFPSIRRITTDTYQDLNSQVFYVMEKPNPRKEKELESKFRDIVMVYNSPVHGLDVYLQTNEDYIEYVSKRYSMRFSRQVVQDSLILNESEFFVFLKKSIFARR